MQEQLVLPCHRKEWGRGMAARARQAGVHQKGYLCASCLGFIDLACAVCASAEAAEGEEQCAVCRMEFEPGEDVRLLPCSHVYHPDCISQWLHINKVGHHLRQGRKEWSHVFWSPWADEKVVKIRSNWCLQRV